MTTEEHIKIDGLCLTIVYGERENYFTEINKYKYVLYEFGGKYRINKKEFIDLSLSFVEFGAVTKELFDTSGDSHGFFTLFDSDDLYNLILLMSEKIATLEI